MSDQVETQEKVADGSSSARSVVCKLVNSTGTFLQLQPGSANLSHGVWVSNPPTVVPAGATVSWESESNGFMTGTEGSCIYIFNASSTALGFITLSWDNPYAGSNSYGIAVTPLPYTGTYTGGSGDNATVTYTASS